MERNWNSLLNLKAPIITAADEILKFFFLIFHRKQVLIYSELSAWQRIHMKYHKNSAEGVIAPAGAKVTGASIRMWLLNKFISFLAVLTWKTGLKKM